MPHPGHCLNPRDQGPVSPLQDDARLSVRTQSWLGYHGLPVEVEVCKELGIHSKEEIEAHGIEPFIQKCQASVWRYMQEWGR